jgi:hypothetical protein
MPVLSIQYDLYNEPSRAYDNLISAIESLGGACRTTESSWLVSTEAHQAGALITLEAAPAPARQDRHLQGQNRHALGGVGFF